MNYERELMKASEKIAALHSRIAEVKGWVQNDIAECEARITNLKALIAKY